MANGIVVRPNVEAANIPALRNAYTKMQALPDADNRSWTYWAGYHGFPHWSCWHHSGTGTGQATGSAPTQAYDLFLPWHRAYLMYWDHVTRDHDANAILPWWDWSSTLSGQIGVPKAYSDAGPLHDGPVPAMQGAAARRTRRSPRSPSELAGLATKVQDLIDNHPQFVDFSNQLQDIHDGMHPWTGGQGGDMSVVSSSAFDPIFWAHHCMIDRIWYLWQLKHGVNNIPQSYLNQVLDPFKMTVSQVLDVRQLGYEYASSSTSAAPAGGTGAAGTSSTSGTGTGTSGATTGGATGTQSASTEATDPNGPLATGEGGDTTSTDGGDTTSTDGGDTTSTDGGDTTSTEGGDTTSTEGGDTTSTEGGDTTSTEGGDTTSTDGGDTTSTEGGDTTSTDGGDTTSTEGEDTTSTEGGDTTSTEGGDTTSTDGGDTTSTEGGDTTSTEGEDTTSTDGGDTTSTEGDDTTSTDGGDTTSSDGGDETDNSSQEG